jgi:hypothetical protein
MNDENLAKQALMRKEDVQSKAIVLEKIMAGPKAGDR